MRARGTRRVRGWLLGSLAVLYGLVACDLSVLHTCGHDRIEHSNGCHACGHDHHDSGPIHRFDSSGHLECVACWFVTLAKEGPASGATPRVQPLALGPQPSLHEPEPAAPHALLCLRPRAPPGRNPA